MNKFLFELGTEEIPASMIPPALSQMGSAFEQLLEENDVSWDSVDLFSSPRRLAVRITGLPDRQLDKEELVLGPPESVAVDGSGDLTRAAEGFARKMDVSPADLKIVQTKKGNYLGWERKVEGRGVDEILVEGLPKLIEGMNWPKNMYWRDSRFRFIRPLRWFVVLWNSKLLDFEFEGISSGRMTRGHRYLGDPSVAVEHPGAYADVLRKNLVLVDLKERREKILNELESVVEPGCHVATDPELLEMVTYLNEYPSVLKGRFDRKFLSLPQEVLVTVMRYHQKYFSVVDDEGEIQPLFLTVVNTVGDPDGVIRKGHERVLKARLEDAAFFWQNDQNKTLEERSQSLDQVLFQKGLGSYLDKTRRVQRLCGFLTKDPDLALAAHLCKADLTTEMVFEMAELQGVMGGLYAREEGMPESVWRAIYDHYKPASMEDVVPGTVNGALLSASDKLDTIVGCFGMGIIPKGSRDPFALRRQAQGVVRILLEHELDYSLVELVRVAAEGFQGHQFDDVVQNNVLEFLRQRVLFVCREKGISYDVLNAVAATGIEKVHDTFEKAKALQEIKPQSDFEALAVAFKRVKNILSKQDFEEGPVSRDDLEDKSERELFEKTEALKPKVRASLGQSDYLGALRQIAGLRGPVDAFFDEVLVLTKDTRLRNNRLRLLAEISEMFLEIADISEIVTPAP